VSGRIFVIAVVTILLTACAATSQSGTEITVEADDFTYRPVSLTVPVGQPVTLTLKNTGAVEHDFVIEKIKVTDVEASDSGPAAHHQTGHEPEYDLHFFAKAGETETLRFTALEHGTYEIFCSLEGHKEAGMIGELIVAAQE
jgi:uncharacterized cupredoxin-like copper-binding protein